MHRKKENLSVGEHFDIGGQPINQVAIGGKPFYVLGKTELYINGELVEAERLNDIQPAFLSYLASCIDDGTADEALDSLFTADEIQTGSTEDGNDGIAVYDSDVPAWISTNTSSVAATETYGRKFQGELIASQGRTITQAAIGFNYGGAGDTPFDSNHSEQTFSGYSLVTDDKLVFNWELYLAENPS